jgi:hypothetical protein
LAIESTDKTAPLLLATARKSYTRLKSFCYPGKTTDHDASSIQAMRIFEIYFCKIDKEKRKRAVRGDRRGRVN